MRAEPPAEVFAKQKILVGSFAWHEGKRDDGHAVFDKLLCVLRISLTIDRTVRLFAFVDGAGFGCEIVANIVRGRFDFVAECG